MAQAIFLIGLLSGIASLVAAIGVARQNWRRDIAPFSRQTSSFKILADPGSYASASAVGSIRTLTAIGYGLFGVAILSLGYQLLADLRGR
jgi:hypothetical protein